MPVLLILAALGFLYFAEQGVELAVLEVGLGGRLDATNVVTPALAAFNEAFLMLAALCALAMLAAWQLRESVPLAMASQPEAD